MLKLSTKKFTSRSLIKNIFIFYWKQLEPFQPFGVQYRNDNPRVIFHVGIFCDGLCGVFSHNTLL